LQSFIFFPIEFNFIMRLCYNPYFSVKKEYFILNLYLKNQDIDKIWKYYNNILDNDGQKELKKH
jgi:hypothetical protein